MIRCAKLWLVVQPTNNIRASSSRTAHCDHQYSHSERPMICDNKTKQRRLVSGLRSVVWINNGVWTQVLSTEQTVELLTEVSESYKAG